MINFENGMLVLNNIFSKDDVKQINAYTDHVRKEERERIIKLLEDRIISMSAYYSRLDEQEGLIRAIALIKGENK